MGSDAREFAWQLKNRGIHDANVLRAMRAVPRQEFVPDDLRDQAYADHPLPIGHGQTISQPYIVAAMTEALRLTPKARVLEVGTGSGYQAAILAQIAAQVWTMERFHELAVAARQRLARLGYHNVIVLEGDGYLGWPEQAPYDGIVVACAAEQIPDPLVAQLAVGGRMVLPVGPAGGNQTLVLLERHEQRITQQRLMAVAFVPLLRERPEPEPPLAP